jgi:hypothetical protein
VEKEQGQGAEGGEAVEDGKAFPGDAEALKMFVVGHSDSLVEGDSRQQTLRQNLKGGAGFFTEAGGLACQPVGFAGRGVAGGS